MRALCDLATNEILQVEKDPELSVLVPVNGKYAIPIPEGSSVQPNSSSVVLPTSDPNSIVAQAYAGLLAQFPQYDNIVYNPLIFDTDVDDLDLSGTITLDGTTYTTRVQTGRQTGGAFVSGQAANSTAILPVNNTLGVGNERPGLLVTDTINISSYLPSPPPGECYVPAANEFMVWWKIYGFETDHDIRSSYGKMAGYNDPALKNIVEVDQEPSDFQVYISPDDGRSWNLATRLIPTRTCAGVEVRLAFVNFTTTKLYLAAFAVIF